MGGLLVSEFITLYVTPAIYLYLEQFQEKVLNRSTFFRSSRGRKPPSDETKPEGGAAPESAM